MITFSSVGKTFNKGEPNEIAAIRSLDLTIGAGSFTVVIGPNGSGKSTVLNLVSGSLLPSTGVITIDGNDVTTLPEYRRSRWIGRVFQDPLQGTAPGLSILDNFRLASLRTRRKGLRVGNSARFREKVGEVVASLGMGIEAKLDRQMGSLSGGQRQALTLLMCTMDDLDILLLDEPTAALDPASARIVMQTAAKIIAEKKLTAILVTHQLKEAFDYGDRLLFLERGEVVRDIAGPAKAGLAETELYSWFMTAGT